MRKVLPLAVFLAISILGCGFDLIEVQSGEKVVCSECGKVIRSDIQTRQVPAREAAGYTVREIKELCDDCKKKQAEKTGMSAIGQWVYENPLGTGFVTINAGGTGNISDSPKTAFTWQSTGPYSFIGTVRQNGEVRRLSGEVVSDGREMRFIGWNPFYGTVGGDRELLLRRVR